MINLCLVVIATQFSETKQRENALMREQRARYMSNDSTLASYSEPGSCYEEMLRYVSHLYRKLTRRLQRVYISWHRSAHTHVYRHTHKHTHRFTDTHTNTHTGVQTHTQTHTHVYTQTHTHTHRCTDTHTHPWISFRVVCVSTANAARR